MARCSRPASSDSDPGELGEISAVAAANVGNGLFAAQVGEVQHGSGKVDVRALESIDGLPGSQIRVGVVLNALKVRLVRARRLAVLAHRP